MKSDTYYCGKRSERPFRRRNTHNNGRLLLSTRAEHPGILVFEYVLSAVPRRKHSAPRGSDNQPFVPRPAPDTGRIPTGPSLSVDLVRRSCADLHRNRPSARNTKNDASTRVRTVTPCKPQTNRRA